MAEESLGRDGGGRERVEVGGDPKGKVRLAERATLFGFLGSREMPPSVEMVEKGSMEEYKRTEVARGVFTTCRNI